MIESYGFFGWIVIGFLAGLIARWIMPGKEPGGCLVTILLGVGGAFVAGYLGRAIGWYGPGDAAGFLAAVVGAIIILFAYKLIAGRR